MVFSPFLWSFRPAFHCRWQRNNVTSISNGCNRSGHFPLLLLAIGTTDSESLKGPSHRMQHYHTRTARINEASLRQARIRSWRSAVDSCSSCKVLRTPVPAIDLDPDGIDNILPAPAAVPLPVAASRTGCMLLSLPAGCVSRGVELLRPVASSRMILASSGFLASTGP